MKWASLGSRGRDQRRKDGGRKIYSRDTIFISKGTPEDDEFTMWLAPRLEAAGYKVFADILSIDGGSRWRKQITSTLQERAIKMLLCGRTVTLQKSGVQEEIGIAEDLVKELDDERFIIPLRLEKFKKVFGIGELQYVNFVGSWARGLAELLDTLSNQDVPRSHEAIISPNWEAYRKRLAIGIDYQPEPLTLNWLPVVEIPDTIRYYQPTGAINHPLMASACKQAEYPAEVFQRGFFSFASEESIEADFAHVGKFKIAAEVKQASFMDGSCDSLDIKGADASNLVVSMYRRAWEKFCLSKGLYAHKFSSYSAFHAAESQVSLGKYINWSYQGGTGRAMLRNVVRGNVWQYGVSSMPSTWPFLHFKLKSRVLFSELSGKEAGEVFDDSDLQHKLRRRSCSGWRNKRWNSMLLGYLQLLSEGAPTLDLPISELANLKIAAEPMRVVSPISTALPNVMDDDAEESDESTLGNFAYIEEEEVQ